MISTPNYQKAIKLSMWVILGVIALGSFLDAISNSITLPVEIIYIFILAVSLCWIFIEVWLKIKSIKWVINASTEITITKLGLKTRLVFVGMLILLILPPLVKHFVTPKFPNNNIFWTVKVYDFRNMYEDSEATQVGEIFSGKVLDYLLKKQYQAQKGEDNDSHFHASQIEITRGGEKIDRDPYPTPYIIVYGVVTENSDSFFLDLRVSAFSSDQPEKPAPAFPLLIQHYKINYDPNQMDSAAQTIGDELIRLIECYPPGKEIRKWVKGCRVLDLGINDSPF